jgi:hypothetical protein
MILFYNFLYFFEELIILTSSTNKRNSNKISLCRNTLHVLAYKYIAYTKELYQDSKDMTASLKRAKVSKNGSNSGIYVTEAMVM